MSKVRSLMTHTKNSKLENATYFLGGVGAINLLFGCLLVFLCKGEHPCIHDKWVQITYVAGHSLLLVSALIFCFLPWGRKKGS